MGSLVKGSIGKEDLNVASDDLYPSTFNRLASTGSTVSLTSFPDIWISHRSGVNAKYYGDHTATGTTLLRACGSVGTTTKSILHLDRGEWSITSDCDASEYTNILFDLSAGAYFTISAGITLTLPSPEHIIAGAAQKIFNGNGSVIFSTGGFPGYGWGGFNISGNSTDNSAALQLILNSISSGSVRLGAGTFLVDSLVIPQNVNLIGSGVNSTILDSRGTSDTIYNTEYWFHQRISDMTITHENNTLGSGINVIDAKLGANSCIFENIYLIGKSGGVTINGLVIRGVDPATSTANNNQYNNIFRNVRSTSNSEITGTAIYLYGQNVANGRCNANVIEKCVPDGFTTGLYVNGGGNSIIDITINESSVAAVHFAGDNTAGNVLINPYLDASISGDKVRLESDNATPLHMVTIIEPVNEFLPSYVADGGGSGEYRFTLISRSHISVAAPAVAGTVNPASLTNASQICGGSDRDIFHIAAYPEAAGGHILLSGSSFDTSINAVGKAGSVSASLSDDANARFSVVTTSNGSSFTKLFSVTSAGAFRDVVTSDGPAGTCTLTANQATTTVSNTAVTASSLIYLFPTSANAAADVGSATSVYISAKSAGTSFTITHPNNANADKTFNYLILN